MHRQIKAYKVDAFLKNGSGGSPTGVIFDTWGLNEREMQLIADEISLSHTAFVIEPLNRNENVKVRFFTPKGEILNCGHGTIAVHYARAKLLNNIERGIFSQEAREGIQQVEILKIKDDFEVYLKQNQIRFSYIPSGALDGLLDSLMLTKMDLSKRFPPILASPGSNRILLGLNSYTDVNRVAPDFKKLERVADATGSIGCFVYSIDSIEPRLEATARMFAPNIGINEDTINGNSSGCLGTYLLSKSAVNGLELWVHQGHRLNRDGVVKVKVKRVDERFETVIGGTAKIVDEFTISLDAED